MVTFVFVIGLLFSAVVNAQTLRPFSGGTATGLEVANYINSAAVNPGDTIDLSGVTITDGFEITKSVILLGGKTARINLTNISGSSNGGIKINADDVTLDGFTIYGYDNVSSDQNANCINVFIRPDSDRVTVSNNTIYVGQDKEFNMGEDSSTGIVAQYAGSGANSDNLRITGNTIISNGGGGMPLSLGNSTGAIVTGNTFSGTFDQGLYNMADEVTIQNNIFSENFKTDSGYSIVMSQWGWPIRTANILNNEFLSPLQAAAIRSDVDINQFIVRDNRFNGVKDSEGNITGIYVVSKNDIVTTEANNDNTFVKFDPATGRYLYRPYGTPIGPIIPLPPLTPTTPTVKIDDPFVYVYDDDRYDKYDYDKYDKDDYDKKSKSDKKYDTKSKSDKKSDTKSKSDCNSKLQDAVIDAKSYTIKIGEEIDIMKNVTAIDDGGRGEDITDDVTIKGYIYTNKPGKYGIVYKVTGGNCRTVSKTITITVAESKKSKESKKSAGSEKYSSDDNDNNSSSKK